MSQGPKQRHNKDLKCGGPSMCSDCRDAQREYECDAFGYNEVQKCLRCGGLNVIWVDLWETNCPKCNGVK